jgi:hypothetical protein
MFHGISSKYHPLTQPVVGYAVGMFEGDLAPTSTRRATKTAFEQRQRKRAATRASALREGAPLYAPHADRFAAQRKRIKKNHGAVGQ